MTDDRTEQQWQETVLRLNALVDRLEGRTGHQGHEIAVRLDALADRLGHHAERSRFGEREVAALRELRARIRRGYDVLDTPMAELDDDVDRMIEFLRLLERSSLGSPGAHALRRRSSPKAVADILSRGDAGTPAPPAGPGEQGSAQAQAVVDALPASVTGANAHLLLRILAHQPGTTIPNHTIAVTIWGEAPPLIWRSELLGYVARLESCLRDLQEHGPRANIVSTPAGLRLETGWSPGPQEFRDLSARLRNFEAGAPLTSRNLTASERAMLSPRELAIVELLAEGKSKLEIARQLHLPPAVVITHIWRIERRLGVTAWGAADTGNRLPRF